jgi:AcrR family transcriptional regulator
MVARLPQNLRSDARDNRTRIIDAARNAFAAGNLDVPMREIARRASVGPATLYRHFSTKESLIAEAFDGQMRMCYSIVDRGLIEPDPWIGFSSVLEQLCEVHARDQGFSAAFMAAFPNARDFAAEREKAVKSLALLISRAKEAGRLRPEVVLDDVILILIANIGIQATSVTARVAASRRFAAIALQGLQPFPDTSPLPPLSHF